MPRLPPKRGSPVACDPRPRPCLVTLWCLCTRSARFTRECMRALRAHSGAGVRVRRVLPWTGLASPRLKRSNKRSAPRVVLARGPRRSSRSLHIVQPIRRYLPRGGNTRGNSRRVSVTGVTVTPLPAPPPALPLPRGLIGEVAGRPVPSEDAVGAGGVSTDPGFSARGHRDA